MSRTFSMQNYQRPLSLIPEDETGEYVSALEDVLDERLEDLESAEYAVFGGVERSVYEAVLDGLDDVESINDLYNLSDDVMDTDSLFPSPFEHLGLLSEGKEFLRAGYLEDVFEEAREQNI